MNLTSRRGRITLYQGFLMNQREGRGESDETKSWKDRGASRGNPYRRYGANPRIFRLRDCRSAIDSCLIDLRDQFLQQLMPVLYLILQ